MRAGLGAIAALVLAYVFMAQGPGWNQNAHYALVRALTHGTPTIDKTRFETGQWYGTGDITFQNGHVYAAKAPGLAFSSFLPYLPLKASGTWNSGDDTRMLWWLALWSAVLPAAILLLLVRRVAEGIQPGAGTLTAVVLGAATLVLPFATLYFAHLLSATLGFAAFAVLWAERNGRPSDGRVAAAGFLAGLAITVEYPLAAVALMLGLYAISRGEVVPRLIAYALGGFAGVLPLLAYQWWAFGSPFHFAYTDVYLGLNKTGVFGINRPSFHVAIELLFSTTGLLRLSPVLALAIAGVILLYRRGRRAEALVIGGIALVTLIYNAGYETPFGGHSPGPRFLIATLPFLALALAPVVAARPATVALLAAPSALLMLAVTATHPIENWDGEWWHRVSEGTFSATVLAFHGVLPLDDQKLPTSTSGWPMLLLLIPVVAAFALALATRPAARLSWSDVTTGAACFGGWLVVQREAPRWLEGHGVGKGFAPFAVLLLGAAVAVVAFTLPALFRPSPTADSSRTT